jgi:hypothetical protein
MKDFVIGIDVQAARGCPFAVLDASSRVVDSGWVATGDIGKSAQELSARYPDAVFAIDAPRMALPTPRAWYWRNKKWGQATGDEVGNGRHCEVVIAAHRLANPQWTPLAIAAPKWMQHGFAIFEALIGRAQTLEVFPTASYRILNEVKELRVDMPLAGFMPGPKDMLDSVIAAVTGHEFLAGRGQEVGGGDGLGTIVLPRPIIEPITDVMRWPNTPERAT